MIWTFFLLWIITMYSGTSMPKESFNILRNMYGMPNLFVMICHSKATFQWLKWPESFTKYSSSELTFRIWCVTIYSVDVVSCLLSGAFFGGGARSDFSGSLYYGTYSNFIILSDKKSLLGQLTTWSLHAKAIQMANLKTAIWHKLPKR